MNRISKWPVFGLLLLIVSADSANANPPKILRATPKNGATNVDPKLTQITLEFDQDMATSYSWTTWGDLFPKVAGRPKWITPRKCVLPVALEAGRAYSFGVNNFINLGFKNSRGEPAKPAMFSFFTKGADKLIAKYAAQNKKAFAELKKAVMTKYSYRDLRKVDWKKRFAEDRDKLIAAPTPDAFAFHAAMLLSTARDGHLWVKNSKLTIPTTPPRQVNRNFSGKILARVVPKLTKHNSVILSGEFNDGIGYILIASFDLKFKKHFNVLPELLKRFAKAKGLIIDVRINGGGSENLGQQFAGRLLDAPTVYAKQMYVNPINPDKPVGPFNRTLQPIKKGPQYRGRVAVLMGQRCMSSTEGFLLMMRQVPNCKLIGERSYGSSGNPQPAQLANGVTVYLPSWQALDADGKLIEGKGIAPDIRVKTQAQDFLAGDPVIAAALRYLRAKRK